MDIDQLLKSKSPKEKMDFLNSMRCKVTTKLKTTDFVAYFHPIFLNKNNYTFCNVFDNKEEFDEAIRIIKKYYKTNFRV